MKERIEEFLTTDGWSVDGSTFKRDVYVPGQQLIINGQMVTQPGRNRTVSIEYLGEGAILNVAGESEPICGYHMGGEDIWVLNFADFTAWYNQIYKNLK